MASGISRLARQAKRPRGLFVKMAAVAIMGLCFIFVWSFFSPPSTSVTTQRQSFDDIAGPVAAGTKFKAPRVQQPRKGSGKEEQKKHGGATRGGDHRGKAKPDAGLKKDEKTVNGSASAGVGSKDEGRSSGKGGKKEPLERRGKDGGNAGSKELGGGKGEEEEVEEGEGGELGKEEEEGGEVVDGRDDADEGESEGGGNVVEGEEELIEKVGQEENEDVEVEDGGSRVTEKKRKVKGPVFDPKARYSWRLCSTRSKHNYIPCIDMDTAGGKMQSYRHTERSCPRWPPMCLVPLPREGYEDPVCWPESKFTILYKNVAHPKLAAFVKKSRWMLQTGDYLTFPQNQSGIKGGVQHYLESIEEMVPDIEWGKNIRVVLDIGCTDSSFGASLLDKEVLTLTLGLKDDLVDLAQVALERGFPTIVSPFARRRLPFPSDVFDVIHCGECNIPWHSNGGKLLLEMNRILRPGGYFILSTKHDTNGNEQEEAMTKLTASICWNILAHKTDDVSDVDVKIYQKPDSNDIYELRRKKIPPICKETENPDAAWYVPLKTCLHSIPTAIEQHGTDWPEEWPKRLETYPDWIGNKDKAIAEANHWKAIVENSYLTGVGINWSTIRNVIDMKTTYGGFATALSQQKVWVMNVIPVHAPDTLPFIFERGLIGVYHDWCESFGTYPRSYDLLHADHLFSRLKNRCRQPVSIVVEMDRIVRPGGWAIIRDKVEILNPLEDILRSLHWEIRMTYNQDREGLLCAQKTTWRPS